MVALNAERRVFLWRVRPVASPSEANNAARITGTPVDVTLDEFISLLEAEHSAGRARVYLSDTGSLLPEDEPHNEKNQLYVAQIRRCEERGIVTLLINRGDPNIAAPSFINTVEGTVRTEEAAEDEVPGASAHLVISTTLTADGHRACFEQMPHVSSSLVMTCLERIVDQALLNNPTYKYEAVQVSKGKKVSIWKTYKPTLAQKRVPSDRLLDDLELGQLGSITLTKKKTYYQGPGIKELIKRQEERVVIAVKQAPKEQIKALVADIVQKAKSEEFESVSFDVSNLPGRSSARPTLSLADADALEQLYVRAQRISGFSQLLVTCYPSICDEIEQKMADLISQGGW